MTERLALTGLIWHVRALATCRAGYCEVQSPPLEHENLSAALALTLTKTWRARDRFFTQ